MHAQCVKDNTSTYKYYTNVKQWECELDIAIYSPGLSRARSAILVIKPFRAGPKGHDMVITVLNFFTAFITIL